MNKRTIQEELCNLLGAVDSSGIGLPGLKKIRTYSDCGLLTNDNGLVLDFASNEQFQITIKRSK